MIWYQQFEYAVGHWLQKASEHVFGCVLCCPGCFSLFRGSALVDDNVLRTYTREPVEGKDLIQFEQGEDRWLCTLLLKRGYKIDYCAGADAKTFAPESFNDFFIQRRRWSPSTLANMIDLINSWGVIVRNNKEINHLFMLYQFALVTSSLFAPATVIILIAGSFSTVLHVAAWYAFLIALTPVVIFAIICLTCKQDKQLLFAGVLSTIYTLIMVIVTIGTILSIVSETVLAPSTLFLLFIVGIFIIAAFIHPKEITCIFGGLLYYVTVPSTFIFLTVFFIFNMNDVSWGTREKKEDKSEASKQADKNLFILIKDLLRKLILEKLDHTLLENRSVEAEKSLERSESVRNQDETPGVDELSWMKQKEIKKFKELSLDIEKEFWEQTIGDFLKPLESNKKLQAKFTQELIELRNKCVYGFFMVNLMLAITLIQLQVSRDELQAFYILGKYEPISTLCLLIFTLLLLIQVVGMLKHRWGTFLHLVSSTELKSKEHKATFEETLQVIDSEFVADDDDEDDEEDEPRPDYEEQEPDYPSSDENETGNDDINPAGRQGEGHEHINRNNRNHERSNAHNGGFNMYKNHVNKTLRRRPGLLDSYRYARQYEQRERQAGVRREPSIPKRILRRLPLRQKMFNIETSAVN